MGTTAYEVLRRRKLEIIQLVGHANLPQRRCLTSLGLARQLGFIRVILEPLIAREAISPC